MEIPDDGFHCGIGTPFFVPCPCDGFLDPLNNKLSITMPVRPIHPFHTS